jgi:membrane protease YdiL (CAAX protease family)
VGGFGGRSAGIGIIVGALAAGGCASEAIELQERTTELSVSILELANFVLIASCPFVLWWLWRKDVIRPGSLSRHQKRDVSGSPWPIWWIGALLVVFAQGVGATLGFALGEKMDKSRVVARILGDQGESWTGAMSALGAGMVALATAFWLIWLMGRGLARSGLELRVRGREVSTGLLGFLAVMPIMAAASAAAFLVAERLSGAPIDPIAHETLKEIKESPWAATSWAMIAAAVILAPIVEEVLFRGLVQSGFLRIWRRPWLSVLSASAIFAAVHVGAVGEARHALAPLFIFGICLGVAFERTGRLWVPVTMHAMFNAVNVALTVLG